MAAPSVQDILGSISGDVKKITANVATLTAKDIASKTGKTTPNLTKGAGGGSDLTGAINAVKALSGIKVADIAKVSVLPLSGIAVKMKRFVIEMGDVKKSTAEAAQASASSVSTILSYLEKANIVKLGYNLTMFPIDMVSKTLLGVPSKGKDGLVTILKRLATESGGAKMSDDSMKAITAIVEILTCLQQANVVKLGMTLSMFPTSSISKVLFGKNGNEGIAQIVKQLSKELSSKSITSGSEVATGVMISVLSTLADKSLIKSAKAIGEIDSSDINKVLFGDGKGSNNGLVGIVENIGQSSLAKGTQSTKIKTATENISTILNGMNDMKIGSGLKRKLKSFPGKDMTAFVDNIVGVATNLQKVDTGTFEKADSKLKSADKMATVLKTTADAMSSGILSFKVGTLGIRSAAVFALSYARLANIMSRHLSIGKQLKMMRISKMMRKTNKNFLRSMLSAAALGPVAVVAVPMSAVGLLGVVTIAGMYSLLNKVLSIVAGKRQAREAKANTRNIMMMALGYIALTVGTMAIGAFVNNFGGIKAIGTGIITVAGVLMLYAGVALLSKVTAKVVNSSKKSVMTILMMGGACMLLLGGTMLMSMFVVHAGGFKQLGIGLISTVGVVLAYGLIGMAAGAVKSTLLQGLGGMGMILAVGAISLGMLAGTVAVTKYAEENGGWLGLLNGIGQVTATVLAYTALGAAASLIVMGPQALVFAAGIAGMGMIATIAALSTSVLKQTASVVKASDDAGGPDHVLSSMKGLRGVLDYITSRKFLKALIINPKTMALVMSSVWALNDLLGTLGKFANVLSKFAGKPGYMRILKKYDKDGSPIYDDEGVAIVPTSIAIADGFSYFSYKILSTLSQITGAYRAARAGRAIAIIMDPVSKFADILKKFETTDDGKIKVLHFDKDGNPTEGKIVDIVAVSTSLADGFSLFSTTILNALKGCEMSYGEIWKAEGKANVMSKIFGPVASFSEILQKFESTGDGKIKVVRFDNDGKAIDGNVIDVVSVATALSTGFAIFATTISNCLNDITQDEDKYPWFYNPFRSRDDGSKKKAELITSLFGPVMNFVDILGKFGSSDDGGLFVPQYDKDGKMIGKMSINPKQTAEVISSGFVSFVTTMLESLKTLSISDSDLDTITKGSGVTKIIDIVKQYSEGMKSIPITSKEAKNFGGVMKEVNESLVHTFASFKSLKSGWYGKMVDSDINPEVATKIVDVVKHYSDGLKTIAITPKEAKNLSITTKEVTDSLSTSLGIYKGKDAKALTINISNLEKKHIGYINKLSDSIKRTKSPMKEYISDLKELTGTYKELEKYTDNEGKIVLSVDKHTETHQDINVDEKGFNAMYEAILPKLQEAMLTAINAAFDGMKLNVPKNVSEKGGMVMFQQ